MTAIGNIVLSTVAILVAAHISFAQTYSITPNDTIEVTGVLEDLQTLTISQLNNTTDTLYFKWEKISESVPANWEASVCDNFFCYTVLMDSGITNPVFPADSGFLLLHVTPHVTYGTAIVRYAIWDIANPSLKDTLTFIATANEPSAVSQVGNNNNFNIFPNPANSDISIISSFQNGFEFFITDVSGKEIYSGISKTNAAYVSTDYFSNGIYSISIFKDKKSFSTKKIVIRH